MGAQYLTTFTSDNDDVRTSLTSQKLLATLDASCIAQDTRRRAPLPQTICPHELGFRAIVQSLLKGEIGFTGSVDRCGNLKWNCRRQGTFVPRPREGGDYG